MAERVEGRFPGKRVKACSFENPLSHCRAAFFPGGKVGNLASDTIELGLSLFWIEVLSLPERGLGFGKCKEEAAEQDGGNQDGE